ncbi:MAG: HAMP domain-containing protein [Chloroflexi bacterium]|nr:HAMP domain-containing protein [Chloroflexota bacterium]
MFPWRVQLAQRIVLSVAAGLALILIIFSGLAVWTVQQATNTEYAARLEIARTLAAETDLTVQSLEQSLRRAALRIGILPSVTLPAEQRSALHELLAPVGSFSTVELIGADGRLLWWGSRHLSTAAPQWQQLPLLATVTRTRDATAGMCPDDEHPDSPSLCLVVPGFALAGHEPGALVAEVDANDGTLPLVPAVAGPGDADVQLLDATGTVVAGASEPARMAAEHVALLRQFIQAHTAGVRLHTPGPGESFPAHLVAYAPLQNVPGWGLALEVPEDEVLAAPHQLAKRLAFFIVGAELLAALLAWSDVHRVVHPLRVLTQAAERFAAGDLDIPVTLQRRDELGLLASTFESMRSRLKASLTEIEQGRQQLEQRVIERTAQIEEQNRRLAILNEQATQLNAALQQRTAERAMLLGRVLSAQEGERERIARDLHDSTGQSLAAVLLSLELLEESIPADLSNLHRQIARSRELTAATLAELRSLIAGLRPAALDDLGLVAALRAFARQWLEENGVSVTITADVPRRLPAAVETAVFRIVQEALTNCAKHAHAQHVDVTLHVQHHSVRVTVKDDGQGFDADQVRADALHGSHVGLLGMRERAELLGGHLKIASVLGQGTAVEVEVPIEGVEQVAV